MLRTIAATIVSLALMAFPALAQTSLAGTSWRFVEVAGSGVPADVTVRISFAGGGTVSGNSGCNGFHGSFGGDGAALSFSNIASTKMLCPEAPKMAIETAVQVALVKTTAFTLVDGKLQFVGANGAVLARLETSPAP